MQISFYNEVLMLWKKHFLYMTESLMPFSVKVLTAMLLKLTVSYAFSWMTWTRAPHKSQWLA